MKVGILITGIARHVKDGYEQFYQPLIEKYSPDIFIYSWNDYDVEDIEKYYSPKKIKIVDPLNFSSYSFKYNNSQYVQTYGGGSLLPMIYCWEKVWQMVDEKYDCIIRSRFDVRISKVIELEKLDLSKINISNSHWKGSSTMDDNLLITNQENSEKIFRKIFTKISSKENLSLTNEINFTNYIEEQGLMSKVVKTDLPFNLIKK